MVKLLQFKPCFFAATLIGIFTISGCEEACECEPEDDDFVGYLCRDFNVDTTNMNNRIIDIWNLCWLVNSNDGLPGCNHFSNNPSMVWQDKAGRLHLRIDSMNGHWQSTSVETLDSVGYGTYTFDVRTNLKTLDENVVLGLSAYAKNEDLEGRKKGNEIGINISKSFGDSSHMIHYDARSGRSSLRLNNYKIQNPGNNHRFIFKWTPDSLYFKANNRLKDYAQHSFLDQSRIPESLSIEHMKMNFWLYDKDRSDNDNEQCCGCPAKRGVGDPPSDGKPQEVVIQSVHFKPYKSE